ncbi:hypothetical protein CJ030_MR2G026841 [Morella rubra]|uniref:Uncharacterized protein n=1 Tax=Morella rubra TaxID=262757 RepID=A0A6A1WFV1_9ROSI|nr:hypothetical protein CJ030_MR2G026841 [Morella rubra]
MLFKMRFPSLADLPSDVGETINIEREGASEPEIDIEAEGKAKVEKHDQVDEDNDDDEDKEEEKQVNDFYLTDREMPELFEDNDDTEGAATKNTELM